MATANEVGLTGLSSVVSHPMYSATVIIWSMIESISCGEKKKDKSSASLMHHASMQHVLLT